MVLLCSKNGGRGDEIVVLPKGQDPTIVDRGSDSWNVSGCKREADDRHIIGSACTIKSISPAEICLDPPPSQTGPDYTGPTGGTLVTVGVGAGSGDHYLNDEDPGGDESEDDDQPTE